MDSPSVEFLQRVANRGLMLSTELSSLVVKLVIGHIKPDRLCADVASTSAVLQRLINETPWYHEDLESIRLITPERIFALHSAARSYENALDIIGVCLRGSIESSPTVGNDLLTGYLGSFVVREDTEDYLICPDRLQDSLSEARQTFERFVKEYGLQYSKTLDKIGVEEGANENLRPQTSKFERKTDEPTANLYVSIAKQVRPRKTPNTTIRHGPHRATGSDIHPPKGNSYSMSASGDSPRALQSNAIDNHDVMPKQATKGIFHESSQGLGLSGSKDSGEDFVLEACTVMPLIRWTTRGYNVTWRVSVMPLQESEVKKELQRLQKADSRNVCEQLDSLAWGERCAIEDFIAEEPQLPTKSQFPHQGHIILLAVAVELIKAEDDLERVLGNMSGRRVKMVIKTKRWSDNPDHGDAFNRYPWIRVHRKHISTRVLNDRGFLWEWDRKHPDHIIIKTWIPRKMQDMLFEQSRDIRDAKNSVINASPLHNPDIDPTISLKPRRRLCTSLRNVFACLTFKKEKARHMDVLQGTIETRYRSSAEDFPFIQRNSDMRDNEKVAEPWKTRKDADNEMEELERQRLDHRIRKRNQEMQDNRNHENTFPSRTPPPYQRNRPSSSMTLPPKTASSGRNIPMRLDSDSGLLVPNEPIPEFGASLTDLAFDD